MLRSGPSMMRALPLRPIVRGALVLGALVIGAGAGCGGATRERPVTGTVRFVVSPDTARIYTDEHFVGTARVLDVQPAEFRVGPRRFTITADGYFPHDLEVELTQGTTVVELALRPVPP